MILGVAEWGSGMVLRGDAYGLRINLAVAGPLLTGSMFVLSVMLLRRERLCQGDALLALPQTYRRVFLFALGLAPIILLLFSLSPGADHTNLDRVAVALTIT